MGREENCAATFDDIVHDFFHVVNCFGVEAHEWLVHDKDFWIVGQGGDERKFLLHAMRERTNDATQVVFETKNGGVFFDISFSSIGGNIVHVANEVNEGDGFHIFVEFGIVRDVG